ncbi:hypothetical protein H0H81_011303 [Sphagnurus paluster]|uniref:Uncharacterized protein n=1 Tax=Sphagnurus paluster TaxID=117069 RepID=A0A9P7GPG7_9AGAR|nr:hypothetical protein H0H81_011303 [Sphagnurus paluster]
MRFRMITLDIALPLSNWLYQINKKVKVPVNTVVFDGLLALSLGLLVFAGDQAISAVFSLSLAGLYVAFTIPILARFLGTKKFTPGPFTLGLFVSSPSGGSLLKH